MDQRTDVTLKGDSQPLSSFALYGGQTLWFPVLALVSLGILFVYSSSSVYAAQKFGNEFLFVQKQFIYLFPGLLAAYVGAKCDLQRIGQHLGKIFIFTLILMILTHAPYVGKRVGGAARWVAFGPLQIQPSELLKIVTVLFVSQLLADYPQKFARLWPVGLCFVTLLWQPDFGSSVILAIGLVAIIFIHGIPKKVFFSCAAVLLPLAAIVMVARPYRVKRLVTFLNPFDDPRGSGFQVIQSFVAIANGGWFGTGLGGSQQKLFFLPEAHTDFILAVIAEEMGFAGVTIICLIYFLLFLSVSQIILRSANHRDRLLATGLLTMLASSALVNMCVVSGLMPTKGLPLPFISSGGSALVANFFIMGLLAQIHRRGFLHHDVQCN